MFIIENGKIQGQKSLNIGKIRTINLAFQGDFTFADDDKFKLSIGAVQSENFGFTNSGYVCFSYINLAEIIKKENTDLSVKVSCNGEQIISDTISVTAFVQGGGGGQVVSVSTQYNPTWWNIKEILDNDQDAKNSAQCFILLINDRNDTLQLKMGMPQTQWAKTLKLSDGTVYNVDDLPLYTQTTLKHVWDKSKDLQSNQGYKTRYILGYSDTVKKVTGTNSSIATKDSVWQYWKNCETESNTYWFYNKQYLQGVYFENCSMRHQTYNNFAFRYYGDGNTYMKPTPVEYSSVVYADYIGFNTKNCRNLTVAKLCSNSLPQNSYQFQYCENLYSIEQFNGEIDTPYSSMTSTTFYPTLNTETKRRIINSLADRTGKTNNVLLKFKNGVSDLTDQEKAIAINKNWSLS